MIPDLISVIVPIYNVEDYIRQCFDSLLNQTYQNFEVLMINDGSPDNSASICQEYAARDSRFRYFEKENGGASSARNMGIEYSEGSYITFVDPDDWLDETYLEILYTNLKNIMPLFLFLLINDSIWIQIAGIFMLIIEAILLKYIRIKNF